MVAILTQPRFGETYMHQWTGPSSVQVMVCCLFSTKVFTSTNADSLWLGHWEQTSSENLNHNTCSNISSQENAFENDVFKMGAIFFRPYYVN